MEIKEIKDFCQRIKDSNNHWTKYPIFIVKTLKIEAATPYDEDAFFSKEYEAKVVKRYRTYEYNFFFSEKDAQDFLDRNKHNMEKPKIFIEHLYRNQSIVDMIHNYFNLANMEIPDFWI